MADNYLEKQMEDYRAGKFAPKPRHAAHIPAKQPVYPPLRVFITGGASGIGRACVEAFREVNAQVAFCDIDQKAGTLTAQKFGARFYPIDASSSAKLSSALEDVAQRWGDIDVIINNVGVGRFKPLEDMADDDWNDVIDINLKPIFTGARFLARHRASSHLSGGTVINISSTRAFQSEPDTVAYSASKGGVVSLTHSLAVTLSRYGITCNCVAPGWINTSGEKLSDDDHRQHPSGRVGEPADVARLILFLANPANDFINGAVIPIDGGMTRKMIYLT